MGISNSGPIWLKMDISLLLKMPYLRNKMPDLSTRHQYQIQLCTTLTRTNLLCNYQFIFAFKIPPRCQKNYFHQLFIFQIIM